MSSTVKTKANGRNARKSTGPKTEIGRATSSRNSLTHGARSRGLIGESEQADHQNFLAALSRQYPSDNPLVQMQLDRIARAKVYVDRIQSVIDATYLSAQQPDASDESLIELLDMDPGQKAMANKISRGELSLNGFVNVERLKIASEVSNFNVADFTRHIDFLEHTPQLCEYLFEEASKRDKDIGSFIAYNAKQVIDGSDLFYSLIEEFEKARRSEITQHREHAPPPIKSLERAISETQIKSLQEFALLIRGEFERVARTHYKVTAFNEMRKVDIVPTALDLDTLDRLQRYQTSAQKQLSTFIGELLELIK